jgi:nitrate reductase gamma subunit
VSLFLSLIACLSLLLFLAGMAWRAWQWAAVPVPFRIPTTAGQQRSLPWIRGAGLESPWTTAGVTRRMALEVALFRSLFRDTRSRLEPGPRLTLIERKSLWLAALAFHWSLLVVVVRHLRLALDPVPAWVAAVASTDGFFQVGLPPWYLSDLVVAIALGYLLVRRLRDPLLRYLTQPADYLALTLLLTVVGSGLVLRYAVRPDLVAVKAFVAGLAALKPAPLDAPSAWFVVHLLAVCVLAAIFPFSKLVHAAGVFFSPTRNQANDSRARRHVNPWDAPVRTRAYEDWERELVTSRGARAESRQPGAESAVRD